MDVQVKGKQTKKFANNLEIHRITLEERLANGNQPL